MSKQSRLLRINGKVMLAQTGGNVNFDLPLIIFEDNGITVCFCPSLNLTGCGHTESEAKNNYDYVISEYFNVTIKKKTLAADLKRMGWQMRKNWKKKMIAPDWESLLERNDEFKKVVEKYNFKKINTSVQIPELV